MMKLLLALAVTGTVATAAAAELDRNNETRETLVIRVSRDNTVSYLTTSDAVSSPEQAKALAKSNGYKALPKSKVAVNELDREAGSSSWYFYSPSYNYGYSYMYWYGSTYSPYYACNYGGYSYYYYNTWNRWGWW